MSLYFVVVIETTKKLSNKWSHFRDLSIKSKVRKLCEARFHSCSQRVKRTLQGLLVNVQLVLMNTNYFIQKVLSVALAEPSIRGDVARSSGLQIVEADYEDTPVSEMF